MLLGGDASTLARAAADRGPAAVPAGEGICWGLHRMHTVFARSPGRNRSPALGREPDPSTPRVAAYRGPPDARNRRHHGSPLRAGSAKPRVADLRAPGIVQSWPTPSRGSDETGQIRLDPSTPKGSVRSRRGPDGRRKNGGVARHGGSCCPEGGSALRSRLWAILALSMLVLAACGDDDGGAERPVVAARRISSSASPGTTTLSPVGPRQMGRRSSRRSRLPVER